jgi:preprotein translocase subunit YajC
MPYFLMLLQATTAPAGGPFSALGQAVPVVLMIAIFYFLVFRPMQRQQKNQKQMVKSLQNGQTVVTSGGLVGTIVAVNDDTLILRIKPDNLKLQVARSAVTSVVAADDTGKK